MRRPASPRRDSSIVRGSVPAYATAMVFCQEFTEAGFRFSNGQATASLLFWLESLLGEGQELNGALRSALGVCGARDIAEFQRAELVIAPSIVSEGNVFQQAQHVGMGKS